MNWPPFKEKLSTQSIDCVCNVSMVHFIKIHQSHSASDRHVRRIRKSNAHSFWILLLRTKLCLSYRYVTYIFKPQLRKIGFFSLSLFLTISHCSILNSCFKSIIFMWNNIGIGNDCNSIFENTKDDFSGNNLFMWL